MRGRKLISRQRLHFPGADETGYVPTAVKNKIKETVCEGRRGVILLTKQPTQQGVTHKNDQLSPYLSLAQLTLQLDC